MGVAIAAGVALGLVGALLFGWFCVRNFRRLCGHADARLRRGRMVDRIPVERRHRRRQRHHRRLAERLGVDPGAFLLVDAGARGFWRRRACASCCSRRSAMPCARCATTRRAPRRSGSDATPCNGRPLSSPAASLRSPGALFAFLKGSVFPDTLGIPLSIDGLVMVLLGGVERSSAASSAPPFSARFRFG